MSIETFSTLNTNQQFHVEFEDVPIGSGQQGKVYAVRSVNGEIYDRLLIKVYDDQSQKIRNRAMEFVSYVETKGLCTDGLSGLCQERLISPGGNRIAFFMCRIPGRTLDDREVFGWLAQQGLSVRLSIAYQVAHSVARLHDARIIHADIADPNVMIDEANQTAYVIDADGGGIRASQPNLVPLVRGHRSGSLMAPELIRDDKKLPSEESDNWSLAVMAHKILFPFGPFGVDPFFFLDKFVDCYDDRVEWPPTTAANPKKQSLVQQHADLLVLIGSRLKELFCLTFSPPGRLCNPSLRTLANTWAQDFEIASRWVWQCPQCQNEMVAMNVTRCPICQSEINHATLFFGSKRKLICTEKQSLNAQEIGFTDGGYRVLYFSRYGGRLQIHPETRLQFLHKTYNIGNLTYVGRGKHDLTVFSKNGEEKANITVQV
jgi:serine/threonine protein kinase